MQLRFANLCPEQGLKVFGVPTANLKEFRSNSAGFEAEPEDKYLMKDESILSAADHAKQPVTAKEQDPEDFNFANRQNQTPTANKPGLDLKEAQGHGGDASVADMSADLSAMFESTMSKV